jgi:hypothetical protein
MEAEYRFNAGTAPLAPWMGSAGKLRYRGSWKTVCFSALAGSISVGRIIISEAIRMDTLEQRIGWNLASVEGKI